MIAVDKIFPLLEFRRILLLCKTNVDFHSRFTPFVLSILVCLVSLWKSQLILLVILGKISMFGYSLTIDLTFPPILGLFICDKK